ncbi:hypothetical protein BCU68_09470 [Vibrio sp. 10N.286.49.B3]|nr:hypothetical protein BCU68_09470 [Vibrio sp. 10N.286.49.B3]
MSFNTMAAAPGVPTINEWGDLNYSFVEVDDTKQSYRDLITLHDEVVVDISWSVWTGDPATQSAILLNGEVVWQADGNPGKASFNIEKSGRYELVVELSNDDGASVSTPKNVVVADTDGAHMEPLEAQYLENNKPYTNTSGSVVSTYFVEWSGYERDYLAAKIPHENLTHLIYAFVPICGADMNDSVKEIDGSYQQLLRACEGVDDFELALHDPWATVQNTFNGHFTWADNFKGNFGQLMQIKQANPDLKIVPSLGGWTLSDPFYFMHDEEGRKTFINSVRQFLLTWKFFDGIDIDWEYPGGGGANPNLGDPEKDGELYVTLMKELREMMDELEAETGRTFELSSAVHTSSTKLGVVDFNQAQQYMDYIYVMSYDMYGAFDTENLGHQSGIYQPEHDVPYDFNLNEGVQHLIEAGVDRKRIIPGVPKYGRGWTGVHDYVNDNPFSGRATGAIKGTWENGVVDYRDIRANRSGGDWEERYDEQAEASYMWNPTTKELITFDNERAVLAKGQYVREHGLGGLMSWEIDGDNGDVLNAMHESLGHGDDNGELPPVNKPPVANAGQDHEVSGPVEVTLDGSASYDPEGEALTYTWTQIGGEQVELINADRAQATVFVPAVDEDQTYSFSLTVTDPENLTGTDSVAIANLAEEPENQPPTVELPATLTVKSGQQFSLTAQANDPENDPLTFDWSVPSNFEVISGYGSKTLVVKAPTTTEDIVTDISVLVSDGQLDAKASTTIIVEKMIVIDPGTGTPIEAPEEGESGKPAEPGTPDEPLIPGEPGELPGECSVEDPNLGDFPAYQAGQVYNGGDTVSHDDLVWKAKWWTQNTAPSLAADVWELHSTVAMGWNADTVYNGGDEVDHGERRYQAKWWTQGENPTTSSVWEDIGEAVCPE